MSPRSPQELAVEKGKGLNADPNHCREHVLPSGHYPTTEQIAAELESAVDSVAARLRGLGSNHGDRVAVQALYRAADRARHELMGLLDLRRRERGER